jgi:hypothetical protein
MTGQELSLQLQIKANGDAARAVVEKFNGTLGKTRSLLHGLNQLPVKIGGLEKYFSAAGGILSTAGGIFFKPLEIAGKATMGLVAGLTAFSVAGIKAAADDEALVAQLTALYGSADKAKSVFKELESVARVTPFQIDELMAAERSLDLVGMGGKKNLMILAAAANTGAASMDTLAMSIARGMPRGMRGLGIDFKEEGGRTTLTFLDEGGKKIKLMAKNADELRAKMMQAISMKFTSGAGASGLEQWLTVIRNGLGQAMAGLFTASLPGLERIVSQLSGWINNLIDTGKIDEWGAKIGEWMKKAWDQGRDFFNWAKDKFDAIKSGGWDGARKALFIIMGGAAEALVTSLAAYLAGTATLFAGLGKIIFSAFFDQFSQLPGMGAMRSVAVMKGWTGMSEADQAAFDKKFPGKSASSTEAESYILQSVGRQAFLSGMQDLTQKLPGIGKELVANLEEIAKRTGAALNANLQTPGENYGPSRADMPATIAAGPGPAATPYEMGLGRHSGNNQRGYERTGIFIKNEHVHIHASEKDSIKDMMILRSTKHALGMAGT